MTLGMIIWLGLMVLNRFEGMPSGSSLMWRSDLMGTGRQLQVGSMVTSSNSELEGKAMGEELRLRVSGFGGKRPMSALLLWVRTVHKTILFGKVKLLKFRKTRG